MGKKVKVFIDDSPLRSGHGVRGIGTYTRSLVKCLKSHSGFEIVGDKDNADVVHYTYFDFFFKMLSIGRGEKAVVTVYDTIPLIYSERYPRGIRGSVNLLRQKRELKKADAVITISETSRKDIVRFLGVPQEKIFPIHLAPGDNFKPLPKKSKKLGEAEEVRKKYDLPERFILYVGDVNYNKNVGGLVRAFGKIQEDTGRYRKLGLVLVGKAFKEDIVESREINGLIKKLGLGNKVFMPGYISDDDLVAVYNLATVYCQPSFYEGFGLPVLEAMACGVPVVAARTQALVEVGEGAVLFVDPDDSRDMASKMLRVISDRKLRNLLRRDGLRHVGRFSWQDVVHETVKVYSEVVSS